MNVSASNKYRTEQLIDMGRDGDVTQTINNWDKFCLLIWKNALLQWRHKTQTIIETLIPVMFSVALIFLRSIVDPDAHPEPKKFEPFKINTLDHLRLVFYFLILWKISNEI